MVAAAVVVNAKVAVSVRVVVVPADNAKAAIAVASDAAQACNAQIAQAHADLAEVGAPTQALSGGPTVE